MSYYTVYNTTNNNNNDNDNDDIIVIIIIVIIGLCMLTISSIPLGPEESLHVAAGALAVAAGWPWKAGKLRI